MPHITEEIWHTLTEQGEDQFLALQSYPETEQVGVKVAKPKVETDVQSASRPTEPSPSKQFSTQVSQSWSQSGRRLFELPDELGKFFGNYSRQLIVVGLFLVALFTLQLALAVDNTLHHLPLVAPLFELIGLGYTIGLIYRHLIWAANRQALVNTIQSLQEQIFGKIDIPRSSGKAEVPESPPLPTAPAQMDQTPQPSALNAQPSNPENPVLQSSTEVYTSLINPNLEQEFERVIGTIRTIRNLRAEAGIKPGAKIEVILQTQSDRERQILKAGQSYVRDLARIESLTITSALAPELKQTIVGVVGTIQVLIPLAGVVDVMTLRTKVQKDLSKAEAEAKSLSTRLSNASFVDKAPADVVQGARDALAKAKKQAEILRDRLDRL
jgi:valyl-tRNA synthetase